MKTTSVFILVCDSLDSEVWSLTGVYPFDSHDAIFDRVTQNGAGYASHRNRTACQARYGLGVQRRYGDKILNLRGEDLCTRRTLSVQELLASARPVFEICLVSSHGGQK